MKYIIYKITIQDYIYVGSTKNFTHRKSSHKSDCNRQKDYLVYNKINELGGWDSCEMIPIEEYECENNIQAHIREEHFRKEHNANLNSKQCYMTETEVNDKIKERKTLYNATHKEENKESKRIYNEANKDKIKEYSITYYENNKEQIKQKDKEFYDLNKERLLKISSDYAKAHREQINARKRELYNASNKDIINARRRELNAAKKNNTV